MSNPVHVAEATPLGGVELPGALNYFHDIDGKLSSGASAAVNAMSSTLKMAEGVNLARNTANPTVTRAAYLAKVERAVEDFHRDATEKLDNARKAVRASLRDAENMLAATVGTAPSANAAETRSVLRAMPESERRAAIAKAFNDGRTEVIGAVVGFDPLLHGCDADTIAALHDQYQQRVAPNEYAAVEAHKKYGRYLDNCGPSVLTFTTRAYGGTKGYDAKRREGVAVLSSYGINFED